MGHEARRSTKTFHEQFLSNGGRARLSPLGKFLIDRPAIGTVAILAAFMPAIARGIWFGALEGFADGKQTFRWYRNIARGEAKRTGRELWIDTWFRVACRECGVARWAWTRCACRAHERQIDIDWTRQ